MGDVSMLDDFAMATAWRELRLLSRDAPAAHYADIDPDAYYTMSFRYGPMHLTFVNVPGSEMPALMRAQAVWIPGS